MGQGGEGHLLTYSSHMSVNPGLLAQICLSSKFWGTSSWHEHFDLGSISMIVHSTNIY